MPALNLLPSFSKRDRILICEGESDFELLDGIIDTERIFIVSAGGEGNLATIRSFFNKYKPIYIRDRDFTISHDDALETLTNQKSKTVWQCYDMEGYLLHADWILEALNNIVKTPRFRSEKIHIPDNLTGVEQAITSISTLLVTEYAGKQTLYHIRGNLGFIRNAYRIPDPSTAKTSLSEWEDYIIERVNQLNAVVNQIPSIEILRNENIQGQLQENYDNYSLYAETVDNSRIHFSGKEIFKGLAKHWGSQYSGELLRNEVIKIAIKYAKRVPATGLQYDSRLGHIALLAEKSLKTA